MKKIISLLIFSTIIIIACNTSNNPVNLLPGPGELKVETFTINIERDTTLETTNGALLKIPGGSLTTDKGNTITLEIKEAYSMEQMLRAGLITGANGAPLSSGGMIYINPAAGQHVTIKSPIQVALPADYLDKDMQLFKGETGADGKINWTEPVALPVNKQLSAVEQGQMLFQARCASCHAIGKDMTGPDLAHFMKRFPMEKNNERYYFHGIVHSETDYIPSTFEGHDSTVDRYLQEHYEESTAAFFYSYSLYKCNLAQRFPGSAPDFRTKTDIPDNNAGINLFKYIQNESDRQNLSLPSHAFLTDCVDSCSRYKKITADLKAQQRNVQAKRKELVKDNGPLVDKQPDSLMPVGNLAPTDFDKKVSPENYDAQYYQFSISSFGWFNVDALLNNIKGVEESELFVRVTGDYTERIKTYLVIPSTKTFGEGGPADRNKEEFAFFYKTGKLPLPQNVKAYIIAVTDTKDAPAFAIKEFTTARSQTIELSLQKGTKDEFDKAVSELHLDRLHITVNDAKNAAAVRTTDTNLETIDKELKNAESLKPKNCDCACMLSTPAADSSARRLVSVEGPIDY